jgi:hypothetical protein
MDDVGKCLGLIIADFRELRLMSYGIGYGP